MTYILQDVLLYVFGRVAGWITTLRAAVWASSPTAGSGSSRDEISPHFYPQESCKLKKAKKDGGGGKKRLLSNSDSDKFKPERVHNADNEDESITANSKPESEWETEAPKKAKERRKSDLDEETKSSAARQQLWVGYCNVIISITPSKML